MKDWIRNVYKWICQLDGPCHVIISNHQPNGHNYMYILLSFHFKCDFYVWTCLPYGCKYFSMFKLSCNQPKKSYTKKILLVYPLEMACCKVPLMPCSVWTECHKVYIQCNYPDKCARNAPTNQGWHCLMFSKQWLYKSSMNFKKCCHFSVQ